jgi:hypothetical protein
MLEGQTQTMKLDDVDSVAFGFLLHWLLTRKFEVESQDNSIARVSQLARAWVLAELFLMPQAQNAIVKRLHYSFREFQVSGSDFQDAVQ